MELENRFLAVKTFLHRHFDLISTEVLENYQNLEVPYSNWAKELAKFSSEEKIKLENFELDDLVLSEEFREFLTKIEDLKTITKFKTVNKKISQNLKRKLSVKKQHEIVQIRELLVGIKGKEFLDIGSGAGHLSSVLLENNQSHSICVDMNQEFQAIGKNKLNRDAKDTADRIKFVTSEINEQTNFDHFEFDTLLGLHTCGDLAVHLIKAFSITDNKSFLNFGCCYHKLSQKNINLSKLAKNDPLTLSHHALTMAAKSYKELTKKEFEQREMVKNYRYTLHLFMTKILKKGFMTLGNAKKNDYQASFAFYAKKYLPELKNVSDKELNQFYTEKQSEIEYIKNLGIIRSTLARVIELYIILDRAIFLSEQNHQVKVLEVFDNKISPRNLAIKV